MELLEQYLSGFSVVFELVPNLYGFLYNESGLTILGAILVSILGLTVFFLLFYIIKKMIKGDI